MFLAAATLLLVPAIGHNQELKEEALQEAIGKAKSAGHRSSIDSLVEKLRQRGYLNDDKPLFDLNDPKISAIYRRAIAETRAAAIRRDTTSWQEIQEAINSHLKQYGPGALIILNGAAQHIYGAIPSLQESLSIRYISTTPIKLTIADVQRSNMDDPSETAALDDFKTHIDRAIGVVKSLGYQDIEMFLAASRKTQNASNIAIGVEETGSHTIYYRDDCREQKILYGILTEYLKEARPTSVLFIGEDLNVNDKMSTFSTYEKYLENEQDHKLFLGLPADDFLVLAKQMRIPVAFGAFGHLSRLKY